MHQHQGRNENDEEDRSPRLLCSLEPLWEQQGAHEKQR